MAIIEMLICSPVERSMSISRRGGLLLIWHASSTSLSVVSAEALTTTTTWLPSSLALMARRAAPKIRSESAMLVPPNF